MYAQLLEIQQRMAADMHDIDQLPSHQEEREEELEFEFTVPEPSLGKLHEIEGIFTVACRNHMQRETLLRAAFDNNFVSKFLALFKSCEDLENIEDCYRMASILRCLRNCI